MGDMPAKEETMHVLLSQTHSVLKATMTLGNGDTKKRKRKKVSTMFSDLASVIWYQF